MLHIDTLKHVFDAEDIENVRALNDIEQIASKIVFPKLSKIAKVTLRQNEDAWKWAYIFYYYAKSGRL